MKLIDQIKQITKTPEPTSRDVVDVITNEKYTLFSTKKDFIEFALEHLFALPELDEKEQYFILNSLDYSSKAITTLANSPLCTLPDSVIFYRLNDWTDTHDFNTEYLCKRPKLLEDPESVKLYFNHYINTGNEKTFLEVYNKLKSSYDEYNLDPKLLTTIFGELYEQYDNGYYNSNHIRTEIKNVLDKNELSIKFKYF